LAQGGYSTSARHHGKQAVHNGMFQEGPIALQHGKGVIKFRKVAIKPL
jgi:hypothetical protein